MLYRVVELVPSGRYMIQKRPKYWPFWSEAFWQKFDRLEDAKSFLAILTSPATVSCNKPILKRKLLSEISRLQNTKSSIYSQERLSRLYRIYSKIGG